MINLKRIADALGSFVSAFVHPMAKMGMSHFTYTSCIYMLPRCSIKEALVVNTPNVHLGNIRIL